MNRTEIERKFISDFEVELSKAQDGTQSDLVSLMSISQIYTKYIIEKKKLQELGAW